MRLALFGLASMVSNSRALSSTCSADIFSPAIIESVKDQLRDFSPTPVIPDYANPRQFSSLETDTKIVAVSVDGEGAVKVGNPLTASEAIRSNTGDSGSVAFVVRRPDHPEYFSGFSIFGVIKETGVDDEGLSDFYNNHFKFPLYKDESLAFYKTFGDRKLGFRSLLKLFTSFSLFRKMKNAGLEGNLVGEGIVQGGLIIFGRDGQPRALFQEETGKELPLRDIVSSMAAVRSEE